MDNLSVESVEGYENEQDACGITDLPDSLICHILSFLPSKNAAATSIFAKRWRYLWTYLAKIDVDFGFYGENKEDIVLGWAPSVVLESEAVVDLSLHNCMISLHAATARNVVLSSLKRLLLMNVEIEQPETLALVFSSCPSIEEAAVTCANFFVCWIIRSSTLQILDLCFSDVSSDVSWEWDSMPKKKGGKRFSDFQLVIEAPLLSFLQLKIRTAFGDKSRPSLHLGKISTPTLVEANINLDAPYVVIKPQILFTSLEDYSTIKSLTLSCDCGAEEGHPFNSSPPKTKFHNLEKLDLAGHWSVLFKLLEMSDNLKELIIRQGREGMFTYRLQLPSQVPVCVTSHLETITFESYSGLGYEFFLLKYLLENGKVLKKVSVCCYTWNCDDYPYFKRHMTDLARFPMLDYHIHKRGRQRRLKNCSVLFPADPQQ